MPSHVGPMGGPFRTVSRGPACGSCRDLSSMDPMVGTADCNCTLRPGNLLRQDDGHPGNRGHDSCRSFGDTIGASSTLRMVAWATQDARLKPGIPRQNKVRANDERSAGAEKRASCRSRSAVHMVAGAIMAARTSDWRGRIPTDKNAIRVTSCW